MRALVVLVLAVMSLSLGGCATKRVMKNCVPMQAEGFQEYSVCEKQYKIWN